METFGPCTKQSLQPSSCRRMPMPRTRHDGALSLLRSGLSAMSSAKVRRSRLTWPSLRRARICVSRNCSWSSSGLPCGGSPRSWNDMRKPRAAKPASNWLVVPAPTVARSDPWPRSGALSRGRARGLSARATSSRDFTLCRYCTSLTMPGMRATAFTVSVGMSSDLRSPSTSMRGVTAPG
jgi:hypothetical protein